MNKLVELFYDVDDFCKVFIPQLQLQTITKTPIVNIVK